MAAKISSHLGKQTMTDFLLSFTEDRRTDREGRRQFFLYWTSGGRRRGQCFFTDPVAEVQRLWAANHTVMVVVPDRP